ncbi:MAG TPA: polymer-forming cytoskeletal protein [Bacillota bacterium]|nr:polymer-forming cytoskeletal protein [Bacillota bacterium]
MGNGTTIIGDIFSTGIVEIQGEVKGNVNTTEDLEVSGKIEGDIKGKNILLNKASIKGRIDAENDAEMKECTILGDVHASNIILDSRLKGTLYAKEKVELDSGAILIGDIDTKKVAIDMGARVKGSIISKEINVKEDEFDFEVSPPRDLRAPTMENSAAFNSNVTEKNDENKISGTVTDDGKENKDKDIIK